MYDKSQAKTAMYLLLPPHRKKSFSYRKTFLSAYVGDNKNNNNKQIIIFIIDDLHYQQLFEISKDT